MRERGAPQWVVRWAGRPFLVRRERRVPARDASWSPSRTHRLSTLRGRLWSFPPSLFWGGWSPMTSSAMWVFSVCAVDRLERTNAAVPVGTLFAGVPRVACCCTFCCRCVFLAAFLGTCAWGLPQCFSFCRSSASPSTPLLPPPLWCAARAFPFFGLRDAVPTGQEGKPICGERRDVLRFLWGEGNAGCSVLFRSCNLYAAAAPCTRPCAVRVFATHTSPPFFSLCSAPL